MALFEEFARALKLMKFAQNHKDVFSCHEAAWLCGFLQALIVFLVELLNVLVILLSLTIQDVVMNFIALAIIADFDDFIYNGGVKEQAQKDFI